jgi:hypothetical protein
VDDVPESDPEEQEVEAAEERDDSEAICERRWSLQRDSRKSSEQKGEKSVYVGWNWSSLGLELWVKVARD